MYVIFSSVIPLILGIGILYLHFYWLKIFELFSGFFLFSFLICILICISNNGWSLVSQCCRFVPRMNTIGKQMIVVLK